MTIHPKLTFEPNFADKSEGLNDAGIETFRDNPFPAVARETGQNSRDAKAGAAPVVITYDKITIPTAELPSLAEFRKAAALCLEKAKRKDSYKEKEFFSRAMDMLHRESIDILRISDTNTFGLRGPCEDGTPFYALIKAEGDNVKDDPSAGGGFGIGKNALYAASDLQTVFHSTIYEDRAKQRKFLCQGKTKFRSFDDSDGNKFLKTGYWGDPKGFMPVSDETLVPEWLHRNEVGTTLCAIAMRETDDWQNELIASILQNFFCAIHRKEMIFRIEDIEINDRTLLRHFEDDRISLAAASYGAEDEFAFSRQLYECLRNNDDCLQKVLHVAGAGKFRIHILMREGLSKRVAILRNGMFIADNLAQFGEKFQRFPMYRDFVAIIEPAGSDESIWLKRMENPRHDDLSPERIADPAKRTEARKAGIRLAADVRDVIKSNAKPAAGEETDLEELSEFFALESHGREDEEGPRNPSSFRIRKREAKRQKRQTKEPVSEEAGTEGGSRHGGDGESGGGGFGEGAGTGSGTEGAGNRARKKPMPLLNPRTIVSDRKDMRKRRILFTPERNGKATLKFESSGLSEPADLSLENGEVLQVTCEKGKRQKIDVVFRTPYDGPLEIVSWTEVGGLNEN